MYPEAKIAVFFYHLRIFQNIVLSPQRVSGKLAKKNLQSKQLITTLVGSLRIRFLLGFFD